MSGWRVTVNRWPQGEGIATSEWLLERLVDGVWRPARRDNAADAPGFAMADAGDYLSLPAGVYQVTVR